MEEKSTGSHRMDPFRMDEKTPVGKCLLIVKLTEAEEDSRMRTKKSVSCKEHDG